MGAADAHPRAPRGRRATARPGRAAGDPCSRVWSRGAAARSQGDAGAARADAEGAGQGDAGSDARQIRTRRTGRRGVHHAGDSDDAWAPASGDPEPAYRGRAPGDRPRRPAARRRGRHARRTLPIPPPRLRGSEAFRGPALRHPRPGRAHSRAPREEPRIPDAQGLPGGLQAPHRVGACALRSRGAGMSERFFIVDGPHFLYRAYHALPYLSNSKGQATHAVRGVSTMLLKLLREGNPAYVAVAWDPPGPTFRESKLPTYKETRAPMPDDLRSQIVLVKRVFEALRLPVLEMPGFEADDVLGTMVARMRGKPVEMVLVTGDKDMLQLVGAGVRALATNVRGEPVWFDDEAVVAKWGVKPGQIPDLLALMGDSIDDIPGVPGVGEKTAVKLISQFGSVERLYENLTLVTGKVRETLATHRDQAFLSRELATVSTRVPIAEDLEAFKRQEPDWERLRTLCKELEFETLLRQLPAAEAPAAVAEALPTLEGAEALQQWLARVPAGDPVAVDWAGDGGPPEPALTLLGVYHPAAGAAVLTLEKTAPDFGGRRLIGHDVKPLIEWWMARGTPPAFDDAAVGAYLLNPARTSYRLVDTSAELLGTGPGLAAAGSRAQTVWQLWDMMPRALGEANLHALYVDLEQPLVPVLAAMERHGIRVDPDRLADFSKELDLTLERLTREICLLAGEEFNIGSPKQMARILFEKLKLPPIKKTK